MKEIEISIRDARQVAMIIEDMRFLRGFISWTSTTTFEVEDPEMADELYTELARMGCEVSFIN